MKSHIDYIRSKFCPKNYRIILLCILGIGIVIMATSKGAKNNEKGYIAINTENSAATEQKNPNVTNDDAISNEALEEILSGVDGVGKVRVLISYKTSDEKKVLKDTDSHGNETTVVYGDSSHKGPFIYKNIYAQIEGVIVVAEGGDRTDVKNLLCDTVSAVLDIPLHKVKVLKMK